MLQKLLSVTGVATACFSQEFIRESPGDLSTAGDSRAAFLPLQRAATASQRAKNPCSFSNISLTKWDSMHGAMCSLAPDFLSMGSQYSLRNNKRNFKLQLLTCSHLCRHFYYPKIYCGLCHTLRKCRKSQMQGGGAIKFFTFYDSYTFKEGSRKNVFY